MSPPEPTSTSRPPGPGSATMSFKAKSLGLAVHGVGSVVQATPSGDRSRRPVLPSARKTLPVQVTRRNG